QLPAKPAVISNDSLLHSPFLHKNGGGLGYPGHIGYGIIIVDDGSPAIRSKPDITHIRFYFNIIAECFTFPRDPPPPSLREGAVHTGTKGWGKIKKLAKRYLQAPGPAERDDRDIAPGRIPG